MLFAIGQMKNKGEWNSPQGRGNHRSALLIHSSAIVREPSSPSQRPGLCGKGLFSPGSWKLLAPFIVPGGWAGTSWGRTAALPCCSSSCRPKPWALSQSVVRPARRGSPSRDATAQSLQRQSTLPYPKQLDCSDHPLGRDAAEHSSNPRTGHPAGALSPMGASWDSS